MMSRLSEAARHGWASPIRSATHACLGGKRPRGSSRALARAGHQAGAACVCRVAAARVGWASGMRCKGGRRVILATADAGA